MMSAAGVVATLEAPEKVRLRVGVEGAVQGVGFRPWIFRLATDLGLAGCVRNTPQGVSIEVEGVPDLVEAFLLKMETEPPALSVVTNLAIASLAPTGDERFTIEPSAQAGMTTAFILPDIATCEECLAEVLDPSSRRYRYPFTNCTHCGPRFSIVEALPYDRVNTTMRGFAMCEKCREEYTDPLDRRFHAQPTACPVCGPQVELWETSGAVLAREDNAIIEAARLLRAGAIVAVKGIGGFHLLVDARSAVAVERLRRRKHREAKPFAVMFRSLAAVEEFCEVGVVEERLLRSPAAPIVLLRAKRLENRSGRALAPRVPWAEGEHCGQHAIPAVAARQPYRRGSCGTPALPSLVAPGSPLLGCMLAYTPLHHLLLAEVGGPVVATSGNRSDEPICITEQEALERLGEIAGTFLVHNRPIARPIDDSVVRVIHGREMILRRARGFAPLPIAIPPLPFPVLAVGAHQKNTVALGRERQGFVSQHLGDLDSAHALGSMRRTVAELQRIHKTEPLAAAADAHPDYLSRKVAQQTGLRVIPVQHHYAHVLSCMVENGLKPPVLGVAWDGSGYGADGTLWGGEFLRITSHSFERVCHLRQFPLPGGDAAAREPRRSALGVLFSIFGEKAAAFNGIPSLDAFSPAELPSMLAMLAKGLNTPATSSAGRLFDAVASLTGLRHRASYEGQAAMELEFAADEHPSEDYYPFTLGDSIDWEPTIWSLLDDLRTGLSPGEISAKFHNTLTEMIVSVARKAGEPRVVLTGGCFQNKHLAERTITRLQDDGFKPYWHQQIPTNDGGISVGQLAAVVHTQR